jgi:carbamoyltransferase
MGFDEDIIITCDHHYSHALTAYCCSPFKEAMVLTADGRGDFRSITLWKSNESSQLKLVEFTTELASPGAFYGFITKYLGFTPDRHEGKVTGLAAHGKISKAYDILKEGYFYDEKKELVRSKIGENYLPFL